MSLTHYLDGDNQHVVIAHPPQPLWDPLYISRFLLDELIDVLACYVPCRCGAWATVASGECPTCHDAADAVSTDQRYR